MPASEKVADWMTVLAAECDRASQPKVAARLGISAAVVNQVLRNRYKGRLDRVEARVRGEFMREVLSCPVLGEISTRQCQDEQRRPFSTANALRVAVFRACRDGCPHYRGEDAS